jgi:hypothetical protein
MYVLSKKACWLQKSTPFCNFAACLSAAAGSFPEPAAVFAAFFVPLAKPPRLCYK